MEESRKFREPTSRSHSISVNLYYLSVPLGYTGLLWSLKFLICAQVVNRS